MDTQIRHLFAQPPQRVVHDPVGAKIIHIPHLFKNLFPQKGSAFIFHKQHQQIKFLGRQIQLAAFLKHQPLRFVDFIPIDHNPVGVRFMMLLMRSTSSFGENGLVM